MWYACGALVVTGNIVQPMYMRSRRRKRADAAMAPIQPMAPTAAPGHYPPPGAVPPSPAGRGTAPDGLRRHRGSPPPHARC